MILPNILKPKCHGHWNRIQRSSWSKRVAKLCLEDIFFLDFTDKFHSLANNTAYSHHSSSSETIWLAEKSTHFSFCCDGEVILCVKTWIGLETADCTGASVLSVAEWGKQACLCCFGQLVCPSDTVWETLKVSRKALG